MNLKVLRHKIDLLDSKIVGMLNERAKISKEIGKVKRMTNEAIYAPAREKEVLARVKSINKGPLSQSALNAIYREIMSGSLALEQTIKVAYLGTIGSFSYMASLGQFGSQVEYVACDEIKEVFEKVEHDECHYGVVPVENSTEGVVTHTVDLLVDSDLQICSQRLQKISQNLLSKTTLDKVKKIYSNPHVFGQCRNWLVRNVKKGVKEMIVASTTEAAEIAAKVKGSAAIASSLAAEVYGLKIIAKNIQDVAHNTTRFLVIAKQDVPPTGKDRTSLIFSIKDKVGALHDMLQPFYKNGINLTKIESRPSKKKAWDYYFFVDFEGHREDAKVKKALSELEGLCKYLKIIGSYPIAE